MRFKAGDLVKMTHYEHGSVGLVLSHSRGFTTLMWLPEGRTVSIHSSQLKHSTTKKELQSE